MTEGSALAGPRSFFPCRDQAYFGAGIVSCVTIPCMKCGFPSFASDTKHRRPYSPAGRSTVMMFSSPRAIGVVPPIGAPGGGPSIFSIQASMSAGFFPGCSLMMTTSCDCSAVFFTRMVWRPACSG